MTVVSSVSRDSFLSPFASLSTTPAVNSVVILYHSQSYCHKRVLYHPQAVPADVVCIPVFVSFAVLVVVDVQKCASIMPMPDCALAVGALLEIIVSTISDSISSRQSSSVAPASFFLRCSPLFPVPNFIPVAYASSLRLWFTTSCE